MFNKSYYVTGIGTNPETMPNQTMHLDVHWTNSLKTIDDVNLLIEYVKREKNLTSFQIVNVIKLRG